MHTHYFTDMEWYMSSKVLENDESSGSVDAFQRHAVILYQVAAVEESFCAIQVTEAKLCLIIPNASTRELASQLGPCYLSSWAIVYPQKLRCSITLPLSRLPQAGKYTNCGHRTVGTPSGATLPLKTQSSCHRPPVLNSCCHKDSCSKAYLR